MEADIQKIVETYNTESLKYPELSEFREESKVGFFRYMKLVFAVLTADIIKMFEKHKAETQAMIDNQEVGQIEWWKAQVYKFQMGDSIDVINNLTDYFKIDKEKQIIKHVVVDIASDSTVCIKAYKVDAQKLNEDELAALTTYCNKIKPVGTKLSVTSTDADKVKLSLVLELNPEVFNDKGVRISDSQSIITDTITGLLSNLNDGMFYISNLIETLKKIEGVKDVYVENSQNWNGSEWLAFSRKLEADSGHIILDENSNINYVFS
jgi:hypothetical protein